MDMDAMQGRRDMGHTPETCRCPLCKIARGEEHYTGKGVPRVPEREALKVRRYLFLTEVQNEYLEEKLGGVEWIRTKISEAMLEDLLS